MQKLTYFIKHEVHAWPLILIARGMKCSNLAIIWILLLWPQANYIERVHYRIFKILLWLRLAERHSL